MKMKPAFSPSTLIAAFSLLFVCGLRAQTFTVLHSFTATGTNSSGAYTNGDGAGPRAGLLRSGNTLYGTAYQGGPSGNGTVYSVNTDGTGFTNLHSFSEVAYFTNSDGSNPYAGLVLMSNTLYGTALSGGNAGNGTIFALNVDGSGFTVLHNFTATTSYMFRAATNSDGARPLGGLVLFGNTLYGTAQSGGASGVGTVFAINTDGTDMRTLYSLQLPAACATDNNCPCGYKCYSHFPLPMCVRTSYCPGVSDFYASHPSALVVTGDALYVAASGGAFGDYGSVLRVGSSTNDVRNLYTYLDQSSLASLILLGSRLYWTRNGTVNSVDTNGLSTGVWGPANAVTANSSGSTLYAAWDNGVLAFNSDGTGSMGLYRFSDGNTNASGVFTNSDGYYAYGGLTLTSDTLYGTAYQGGPSGNGTVFSISFTPRLTITLSGIPPNGIILSWPTNFAGFDFAGYVLQSTTNLDLSTTWVTNSPAPVVINGNYTVTNLTSGRQQFYRLVH
jgi:uncharacterized repeat protein (TIGR03803 family)